MIKNLIDEYSRIRNEIVLTKAASILERERIVTDRLISLLTENYIRIKRDFDNAYKTRKYWEAYAPEQRGHKPRGEAYPWGEVGEKVIEGYLYSLIPSFFKNISFPGIPFGHDVRFLTETEFIHIDVKSTGPTDNVHEVVSSPNQVTGTGMIDSEGIIYNEEILVHGPRVTNSFRPELAPFYIESNQIIPVLTFYLKIVYSVVEPGNQPLEYIELICVPNGIALFLSPNYNQQYTGILTPGKDEKHVQRRRVRIKLNPLSCIDSWRCQKISLDENKGILVLPRSSVYI